MDNSGNYVHVSASQLSERPLVLLRDDQLQLFLDLHRDSTEIPFRQEQMLARIDDLQNHLFGSQPNTIIPPWNFPSRHQDENDGPQA